MKLLLLSTVLLIGASTSSEGWVQGCSEVSIESESKVQPGTPIVFTARAKDVSPSEVVTYKWKLSGGSISSGENTATIAVDTTGLGGLSITVTVQVLARGSSCSGSKTVDIAMPPPVDGHFDQYGDIKFRDEAARLDNFAIQLMNEPTARGVIVTFAGNPTYKGEAAYRLRRAKNYLVNVRKIPSSKVMTIDGGYREDLTTTLIIVPTGVQISPSAFIWGERPQRVRFTKPRPARRQRK